MDRRCRKMYLAAAILASMFHVPGCNDPKSTDEYRDMERMAGKLRAYVEKSLSEENMHNTGWSANASSFFAREMECVAGAPPKTKRGSTDIVRVEVKADYEGRIRAGILNPDALVEGMSAKGYDEVLGWALSANDMKRLREIRAKCGYWDELKTALAPSEK